MPTPVRGARQCLTKEAAQVLDEAVAVARRRGHTQTTSLHAVAALLSSPASLLRDACARARNVAYSRRLQFKALDLCLGVSLDRVPSTQLNDDPPVSNSLMAAIKRSQANQRRQPQNFNLCHQISQQYSSVSCIKVELRHLILSILDDPVVSRVFGEAGFRSFEIKLAVIRPLPQLLRYSRSSCDPPLFLSNFTDRWDPGCRSFAFPFPGQSDSDDNIRKIGEILVRSRCNNPLLVGASALDALQNFTKAIEKREGCIFLPTKLSGLNVISIGDDISKFVLESDCHQRTMNLTEIVKPSLLEPGLLVNMGDLNLFLYDQATNEAVSYVVTQLTNLLKLHSANEKVWLIGGVTSYECYLKFVRKFPSIDKDWDLQLLPITSLKHSVNESFLKLGASMMESFVPLGGFFSAPPELIISVPGVYQHVPRGKLSDDNCKEASTAHCQSISPSLLQIMEQATEDVSNMKTQHDGPVLDFEDDLHRRWDEVQFLNSDKKFFEDKLENIRVDIQGTSENKSGTLNFNVCSHVSAENVPDSLSSNPFPVVPNAKNLENLGKVEDLVDSVGLASCSLSNSSAGDRSEASPTSVITTNLGLAICSSPTSSTRKCLALQHLSLPPEKISGCFSANEGKPTDPFIQTPSCSCSDRDFKMISGALREKVGWQDEAANTIGRLLALPQTRGRKFHGTTVRGAVWLNFVGPDKYGKRKMASTLAELYSQGNIVFVNLSSFETKGYDAKFRGKTAIDYIVGELLKKPLSVVFLDNVDKADVLEQNSLSRAVGTGKISDSYGREVSLSNAIFVTCFSVMKKTAYLSNECCNYTEEAIMSVKVSPMQITIENAFLSKDSCKYTTGGISDLVHKRKPVCDDKCPEHLEVLDASKRTCKRSILNLDLNLPANEDEPLNPEKDSNPEIQNCWFSGLFDKMAETVLFKPCNFDALADSILREIMKTFHTIVGFDCVLEIVPEVMRQLVAAAYASERHREVEDWIEQVLSTGFLVAQKRHNLSSHSKVKLATIEGAFMEKQAPPGVYLPSRIMVHSICSS